MSTIADCPSCGRKLRVPEELHGRLVQCPGCGVTFTADVGTAEAPPPISARPSEAGAPGNEPLAAPGRQSRPVPPPWSHRPDDFEDDYDDRLRRYRRRDVQPHRGTLILVFGILSIVLCWPLGIAAWVMGNTDMQEIRWGRMDPEGEGTTNAGRICGIIGTIFGILWMCAWGSCFLMGMGGRLR